MSEPITELAEAVAIQVRVELAAARMDQATLAAYVGIERATLNRYLNMHTQMPLPVFFRIAQAFGIAPDELMRRAEERMEP